LLNINEVVAKNDIAVAFFLAIDTRTNLPDVPPQGVFPTIAEKELVSDRMKIESNIAVVEHAKVVQDRVLIFVQEIRSQFPRGPKHC